MADFQPLANLSLTSDDHHTIPNTRRSVEMPSACSASSSEGSPPAAVAQKTVSRRIRISSACLECKARRRKCNGETPCHTCRTLSAVCLYEPGQDRRSKAYFQKKLLEGTKDSAQPVSKISQPASHSPRDQKVTQQQNAVYGVEAVYDLNTSFGISESVSTTLEATVWPLDLINDITSNNAWSLAPLSQHTPTSSAAPVCTSSCALLSRTTCAPWYSAPSQFQQLAFLRQSVHQVPTHQIFDHSPLSMAYTDFKATSTQMMQLGHPLLSIIGDIDPYVDLLFGPRTLSDALSATTWVWACEVTKQFMPFDIYTQMGYVFLLSRLMRWTLSPTLENWILLPPIIRPTDLQRQVPHYPSADMQPLPVIRDALVRGKRKLDEPVGDVERAGTQCIKMYWPFEMDAAVEQNPVTGHMVLSRLFTAAAADETSWSCGSDFAKEISCGREDIFNIIVHDHVWEGIKA